MTTTGMVAAIAVPVLSALYYFATNYGYKGLPARQARREAQHVGVMLTVIVFVMVLTSCVDGRTGKVFLCGVTEKCK